MKHFLYTIFSVIALSTSAHAESWKSQNNAGGMIVLTDRICEKYASLFQMYATNKDGETINGCWALYDGLIHVAYNDKTERTYLPSLFIKDVAPKADL